MWSRAINLKICIDLSTTEFLRALQLHCFQYGLPQLCITDLGTQLTHGGKIITDFLNEAEVSAYFAENSVECPKFEHYFKGCSQLGGMVEVMVKMVKRLIFGSIKNNVLPLRQFEYLVEQVVHLCNKRPVAFKDSLRDSEINIPESISPEKLIHGYDLVSVNLIPDLQPRPDDPDFSLSPIDKITDSYDKLRRVRNNLIDLYNEEFVATLVSQAVDRRSRYKPVNAVELCVGDIVLIKESNMKPQSYPMAMVNRVHRNEVGTVTHVEVRKGSTREINKRHVTAVIPLLQLGNDDSTSRSDETSNTETDDNIILPSATTNNTENTAARPVRQAALRSRNLCREHLSN